MFSSDNWFMDRSFKLSVHHSYSIKRIEEMPIEWLKIQQMYLKYTNVKYMFKAFHFLSYPTFEGPVSVPVFNFILFALCPVLIYYSYWSITNCTWSTTVLNLYLMLTFVAVRGQTNLLMSFSTRYVDRFLKDTSESIYIPNVWRKADHNLCLTF